MEGYILSKRLKELRGDKTQAEVAEALGIESVTLGRYEHGVRHPNAETLYKIAQYYNVSADYLIGLPGAKDVMCGLMYDAGFKAGSAAVLKAIKEFLEEKHERFD